MALKDGDRRKIQAAIAQLRADIDELDAELSKWDNESTQATKKYRSIAERITTSTKRLSVLVREHTYSN